MAKQQYSVDETGRRSYEERNALVLEANGDGIFDANLVTGQNYYSAEWLSQIGYLPDDLPGTAETWLERIHPEDRQDVEKALGDYLAHRTHTYRVEYRMRHRAGHWCWVQARAKAVWNEEGQAIRLVGSHREVWPPDERRMQAEIRNSEARYRELFERNPLPGWIYGTGDFKIVDVNQAAVENYGWSRHEFLNLTIRDLRMPEEFDAIEAHLLNTVRPGGTRWHHRRKDGSVIPVELTSVGLESGGAPLRLVLANDVSARVEAEQQIRLAHDRLESLVAERTKELTENQARMGALLEASPQMIWATGPNGEYGFISPYAFEYTGVPVLELAGNRWMKLLLHPEDLLLTSELWQRSCDLGEPFSADYRLRSKEGEYRWFRSMVRPERNAEGQIIRWLGVTTDIQDQKDNEKMLEAAVASRTLELAEARDRAESATLAKSTFLAAMSHEIRTPMNGVIGMANLMLETDLTSEQRCYMDTIRSSGDALLTVINDILDLSKIEAGRLSLEKAPFDLSTLVEEAFEVVGAQAAAKNLKLIYKVEDNVPLDLVGDPIRLRQVVLNLLSNAVKFTAEGSVSLLVSREAKKDRLTVLRFAVRDTGIGLTQSQQGSLFEAFHQAELSTTRLFGGTGLGLAISKRLVEAMGGAIGVHSIPGQGSSFFFNVFLETAPALAEEACFKDKHAALIHAGDAAALNLVSHLAGAGMRVTRYARIPQSGRLLADLVLVDSGSLSKRSVAAQLLTAGESPIVVLGTPADFNFQLPESQRPITFVEKPVRRLPLLRAVQAIFEGAAARTEAAKHPLSANAERAHVLLAEDNKVNQLVARILLERMGCRVDIVENGVAACRAVQNGSYDLVLMDCQMPAMSGFEATQRIRSFEPSGRRTPIVALTAGVLQEERERCYESGMDDFVAKPISAKELEKAVERWIATAKAER